MGVSDGSRERLSAARSAYEETLARAKAGDLGAVREFPQVAQQLLGIGRDTYASGAGFQDLFRDVNAALSEVLDRQRSLQADILADLPAAVMEASQDQVSAILDLKKSLVQKLDAVEAELRMLNKAA